MILWLALARAVHIGASILLAGLFGFRLVVLAPIASRHGCVDQFQPRFKGRWGRLALVGWSTMVLSALVWFGLVTVSMSGAATLLDVNPDTLQTVLLQTHFGNLWAFRVGGCLILGILLFIGFNEVLIAALSFAILASLAAAGHVGAIVAGAGPLPVIGDIGHLIAAAFWPGGLLPLLLLLFRQYSGCDPYRPRKRGSAPRVATRAVNQSTNRFAADVVRRFSALSLMVVGLLVATGLLNTYFIVGSLGALFTTDYGRLLLFKIALFVLMLCLGAWNLIVLKPRLSRAAIVESQTAESDATPIRSLIRSVVCETLLAAGIVLVIGFLGTTPPPMH